MSHQIEFPIDIPHIIGQKCHVPWVICAFYTQYDETFDFEDHPTNGIIHRFFGEEPPKYPASENRIPSGWLYYIYLAMENCR